MAAMAALLKVVENLERGCMGVNEMNYCPETVLVHSAFLLADKEAGQSLNGVEKGKCGRLVHIVSATIREITREALHADTRKLLLGEVRQFEFKIHSWLFVSLLKSYYSLDLGDLPEEDYFDSFPPLPQFGINFYLELVQDMEWSELLVESLCEVGVENLIFLLEDIVKCLTQDPSITDLSLFYCLFNSLLVTGKHNLPSDKQDVNLDNTSTAKSCSLLLLKGVACLTKDYASWPEMQVDIIKSVIDFTISDIVDLNFQKHRKKDILNWWLENSIPHNGHESLMESTTFVESELVNKTKVNACETSTFDLVVSAEVTAGINLLYQVILNDWRATSHWVKSEECNSNVGELDSSSWHPLHRWIIKLHAITGWLISHSHNSRVVEQASRLQTGLAHYVKTYSTETELIWIDGFKRGELIDLGESKMEEEFNPPTESVDLLLFQPETTEEQFHFYLQQVNGRLEGYKECFDWLLSAEEFHSEPDWLECMRNNAVEISDIEHVLKMIDIIYMQGQLLYSEEASSDIIYRDMKEVLLSLYSTFPCSSQEQIIEYAFFTNLALKSPGEDSIFFHPYIVAQDRTFLQQDLVMMFNKLIDISSEDQLHSAVKDLARAFLISPHLTLNKAVQEGVKSAGHSKSVCSVLQKFPVVCTLRCSESVSSQTLLCKALNSVTLNVSSRQQENNLLNMVAMLLSGGSSESSPLLSVQEFTEAIVLPFLNNTTMQGNIPTVLALKLLDTSMSSVMASVPLQLHFLKKHSLPIILCLCELLNECNVFWDGLAPVHSLSEMEELRELVLKVLDAEIKLCCDVLEMTPSFARGVEWLLKRLRIGYDWTVLLHLEQLFNAAYIKHKIPVPDCLLNVCEDIGEEWVADKDLAYGMDDVFTLLFEYCRVSESTLQRILESIIPNKLTDSLQDIRRCIVTSLAQILPHCTWNEWKRILKMCRHLIRKNILEVGFIESVSRLQENDNDQDICQLSALLLCVMEALHSPLCSSWATPHVWLYIIKHYTTAVKEMVDQTTDAAVTAPVFAHVCHVMTFAPADCADQLFVLVLDLVGKPSVTNDDIIEQMKLTINSLSSEVYKAALMQKLCR